MQNILKSTRLALLVFNQHRKEKLQYDCDGVDKKQMIQTYTNNTNNNQQDLLV